MGPMSVKLMRLKELVVEVFLKLMEVIRFIILVIQLIKEVIMLQGFQRLSHQYRFQIAVSELVQFLHLGRIFKSIHQKMDF